MVRIILLLVGAAAFAWVNFRIGIWRLQQTLDKAGRPLEDDVLGALIVRLAKAADAEGVNAQLVEMPMVNGLAAPDGRIYLTTALFDKYRFGILKAEEVASVVAHEMGHVALGHHQRRLIDWTGQSAARLALGLVLNRFIPFIGFYIANALSALFTAQLSRRDEFEADRYATALMLKAGIGHAPQIEMFRKLERMSPGPKGAAWLQSHPPVEQRIAAIEENASAWAPSAASSQDG